MATKTAARSNVRDLPATRKDQVPANRAARLEAAAGRGVSTDRDDKIIPMIRRLQSGSPQCLKQKPEYIKGAEAGMYWFKGALEELVEGRPNEKAFKGGFTFIPAYYTKCWLEFDGPRDDNPKFVRRHEDKNKRPADVPGLTLDEEGGYDYVDLKTGHRFSLSREFYGLVDGKDPWLFPFGGAAHTTAREWQTLLERFRLPSGKPEPSYNRKYRFTTVPKTNESGDWYDPKYEMIGTVTDEEFDLAEQLYLAVRSGAVHGEEPDTDPEKEDKGGGHI